MNLPLGKNFRTRTTTLTFPPGVEFTGVSGREVGTITPSLDRRDGVEAEDFIEAMDEGA